MPSIGASRTSTLMSPARAEASRRNGVPGPGGARLAPSRAVGAPDGAARGPKSGWAWRALTGMRSKHQSNLTSTGLLAK
jgi:hypothetical protein